MPSFILLDMLVIDPEKASRDRLKAAMAKYRRSGKEKYISSLNLTSTLEEARRIIEMDDVNCVVIDPLQIGLAEATEFIFRIRRAIPRIIFVLYSDSNAVEANEQFYKGGDRDRFHHYFKLNKLSHGKKLDMKVLHTLHLCMSDIRLQTSLARRQVADMRLHGGPPVEITKSLGDFLVKFHGVKTAFIMMSFENSSPHAAIAKAIRDTLRPLGITALRADDFEFHDNLYDNIRTYMHGCDFGIAVIERISTQSFNPNIALEVGYMKALNKPVCILKDKSMPIIQTDLLGALYREFDCHKASSSIKAALNEWAGSIMIRFSKSEQGAPSNGG
jgi:nucleoside 2-deoxyribosyltransferase